MYFSNNLILLLLLLAPTIQPGQGAPSHNGEQLAAEEDEEINDSEDFVKVFKEDQLETDQELDTTTLGVSDEQTVHGTDLQNVTEDVNATTNPSGVSGEETVSGIDATEDISTTKSPSGVSDEPVVQSKDVNATTDPSPSISLDQALGEDSDIPTTIVGQKLATEDTDAEATEANDSSTATMVSNEDSSQEGQEVPAGTTGLLTTLSGTDADKETTLNGVTEGSSKGNDSMTLEGSKAPGNDVTEVEPIVETEPSENEMSIKSETTVSSTSSFVDKAIITDDQPSDNDSQSDDDNSDTTDDDSEHYEGTNSEDYMQAIDQFQKQDFSKEGTSPSQEEEDSVSWESTSMVEGSLYLEPSSEESSGADSGKQVDEQDQAEEDQEKGEEIEESRSLLSRWWLWLIMLCLGLGLGLLCRARMNASKGEAEYLRMGERHQGSTITIPR